jgi:hypothetical protein
LAQSGHIAVSLTLSLRHASGGSRGTAFAVPLAARIVGSPDRVPRGLHAVDEATTQARRRSPACRPGHPASRPPRIQRGEELTGGRSALRMTASGMVRLDP